MTLHIYVVDVPYASGTIVRTVWKGNICACSDGLLTMDTIQQATDNVIHKIYHQNLPKLLRSDTICVDSK